jgi:hypothetical protein
MAMLARRGWWLFPVYRRILVVCHRRATHLCRWLLLFLVLVLLIAFPVGCWVWFSFLNDAPPPSDPSLAPPTPLHVFPFRDLCDAVASPHAAERRNQTDGRATQSQRLQHVMQRLLHIPADGGAAGVRWSEATGLPTPMERNGLEVRAHFVTLSTRIDDFLQATTTAATMAGVPLEVVGVGWTWFAFTRRMELICSFLDQDGNVTDEDIIVVMDADALLSGEDVYDTLAAFAASTATSVEEHATYSLRDIRLGRRQPPVLYSAEYNCMHAQAYASRHLCRAGYDTIDEMMQTWSQQSGVPLPSEHRGTNPFRYLNAGVVVARVWALRRVWAAAKAFMSSHVFYAGDEWWCDQSVLGSLYLQLRWWEIRSSALDLATPQPLSRMAREEECLFAPLVLADPQRGPHGLPGGLIGLDHAGRISLTISMQMEPKGVMQVGTTPITQGLSPEGALNAFLNSHNRQLEENSLSFLRSSHRVELVPRRGFDCDAAADNGDTHPSRPPECAYRAAVLGLPDTAAAVTPLIWHFAGKYKRLVLTRFRVLFPWYTPMLWNASVRAAVLDTLFAAPPTRLWYMNATTDLPFDNVVHALYPHHDGDDVSPAQLCEAANVRTPNAAGG